MTAAQAGTAASGYALQTPCKHCPFRTNVPPYLRPARAREIADALRSGSGFPCHKTTVHVEDGDGETARARGPRSQECAGALIVLERDGGPNQMGRIAERLGLYDPSRLDMGAPVYATLTDWVRSYADGPPTVEVDGEALPYEHCGVVGPDCADPAGYGGPGGVYDNDDDPTCHPVDVCTECGNPVCSECRAGAGRWGPVCVNCAAEGDDG